MSIEFLDETGSCAWSAMGHWVVVSVDDVNAELAEVAF